MSIWGRLAGAAAGLAEGGVGLLGAFAGGHTFHHDSRVKHQVAFTIGVIALGAKMAKADGMVTRDEVVAFTEVFKVPEGEMENVLRVFNLAKQDVVGYEAYADQLASLLKGNRKLLEDVLEVCSTSPWPMAVPSKRGAISRPGSPALRSPIRVQLKH